MEIIPYIDIENFSSIDTESIKSGIPASLLMENAGNEMGRLLISRQSPDGTVVFLCGTGNNGGDGLVAARYLIKNGFKTAVLILGKPGKGTDLFKEKLALLKKFPCRIRFISKTMAGLTAELKRAAVIVDAIFGTGLNRAPAGLFASVIHKAAGLKRVKKVALDIPSGLTFAAKGGAVFAADQTYTVQYLKNIFLLPWYAQFTGAVSTVKIDFPEKICRKYLKNVFKISADLVLKEIEFRHKLKLGRSMAVAGSKKYTGAGNLAVTSALAGGCPYLYALSSDSRILKKNPQLLLLKSAEEKAWGPDTYKIYQKEFSACRFFLFGPGVDRLPKTTELLGSLLRQKNKKIIIDADGIYHLKILLADKKIKSALRYNDIVITPHTGELAMLLGVDVGSLQEDFFSFVPSLYKKYGLNILLKDVYSFYYNGIYNYFPYANSFLAKAGSGDILAGLLLAYISRSKDFHTAVAAGLMCYINKAAEVRARYGTGSKITRLIDSL